MHELVALPVREGTGEPVLFEQGVEVLVGGRFAARAAPGRDALEEEEAAGAVLAQQPLQDGSAARPLQLLEGEQGVGGRRGRGGLIPAAADHRRCRAPRPASPRAPERRPLRPGPRDGLLRGVGLGGLQVLGAVAALALPLRGEVGRDSAGEVGERLGAERPGRRRIRRATLAR